MKSILLPILLLVPVYVNAQKDTLVNHRLFEHVEKAARFSHLQDITTHFEKIAESDSELIEMTYYWIAQNIEYDLELMNDPYRDYTDISVEQTLEKRKTICSGYATLFCEILSYWDIGCEIVSGVAITLGDTNSSAFNDSHAWNAVFVQGQWELIDPTWEKRLLLHWFGRVSKND